MSTLPDSPLSRPTTAGALPAARFDGYLEELFAREDDLLKQLRAEMERQKLPVIQVPATSGRALQVLAAAVGARRILEVGTLAGYSAIWMARALPPGGALVTLEKDEVRAALAMEFVRRASLETVVDVRVGEASELLQDLDPEAPFDLVFVDADKEGNREYAEHAARLLRPGGLLIVDNALWRGTVLEEEPGDERDRAVAEFNREIADDRRFLGTILTVGDGLLVAVRR